MPQAAAPLYNTPGNHGRAGCVMTHSPRCAPAPSRRVGGGVRSLLGPIFNREWLTVPRQPRHYVNRAVYLGLLWGLGVTAWQMTVGWAQSASLGEAARFGLLLFQIIAFV